MNTKLLKRLCEIFSPSGKEQMMIQFLISYIKFLPGNITLGRDKYGNLYAVKGEAESYPCIVAHLDQVGHVNHSKDFRCIETRDIIFGYSAKNHRFENCGFDDKVGIWIALECLKKYDCLKVAFFREEETGCGGSSNAEMSFFENSRYVLQCDRRGNSDIITNISFTDLCSEKFIEDIEPEKWGYQATNGMMTDVLELKEKGLGVSAINLSCGYFSPHTEEEIVVKHDVQKCLRFVEHIIETCVETYPHVSSDDYWDGYYQYEMEDELYEILSNDPALSSDDLFDMYHTNYPQLKREDFKRIVEDCKLMYGLDDENNNEEFNLDSIKIS